MTPTPVLPVPDRTVGAYGYPPVCRGGGTDSQAVRQRPSERFRGLLHTTKQRLSTLLALIIQASRTPRHVTPVQPEYREKPAVHPAGESLYRDGMGNAYSCIPWSGYEYGLLRSSSKPPSMNNRG